jgi:hypothetical protein
MTIEFALPIKSISPSIESKNAFKKFAQTKVIFFDNTEECDRFTVRWLFKEFGHTTSKERNIDAGHVLLKDMRGRRLDNQTLEDFVIVINKPSFIIDNNDFSDLVPLVIEHEIAELWYTCKKGYLPIEPHKLAIIEETKMATRIGQEERSIQFHDLLQKDRVKKDSELMRRVVNNIRKRRHL